MPERRTTNPVARILTRLKNKRQECGGENFSEKLPFAFFAPLCVPPDTAYITGISAKPCAALPKHSPSATAVFCPNNGGHLNHNPQEFEYGGRHLSERGKEISFSLFLCLIEFPFANVVVHVLNRMNLIEKLLNRLHRKWKRNQSSAGYFSTCSTIPRLPTTFTLSPFRRPCAHS